MVDEFDFQKVTIQFVIFIKYNGIITMMKYFIRFFLKIEGIHFFPIIRGEVFLKAKFTIGINSFNSVI